MGNEVRHNGGHKKDAYITGTLAEYFDLCPLCPEVGIGLGIPRPAIRLVEIQGETRVQGVKDSTMDVTLALAEFTENQRNFVAGLYGFIFKKASPSCGMERVKLYNQKGIPENRGVGIFAAGVMAQNPNLPVEEEGRLGDARLRENFIQRVFIYHCWRTSIEANYGVASLTGFHARIKLTLMSHDQNEARTLGRLAATVNKTNVAEVGAEYITGVMQTLKLIATRKNHVNVLQHIQGYLKKNLDKDDKAELVEVIAQYADGQVPLIVPVTLLKHHFRRNPDPYINGSWYFSPYPGELRLRNLI